MTPTDLLAELRRLADTCMDEWLDDAQVKNDAELRRWHAAYEVLFYAELKMREVFGIEEEEVAPDLERAAFIREAKLAWQRTGGEIAVAWGNKSDMESLAALEDLAAQEAKAFLPEGREAKSDA